jgi:hypothetical protein
MRTHICRYEALSLASLRLSARFAVGALYFCTSTASKLTCKVCLCWGPQRIPSAARVCTLQHTSAYVSIRQHTSTYVSAFPPRPACAPCNIRQHTSAYVSIRQHTSAHSLRGPRVHPATYVSIRQHTSTYVSLRPHTSAYVSIRQHAHACAARVCTLPPIWRQYLYVCTSTASYLSTCSPLPRKRAAFPGGESICTTSTFVLVRLY